MRAVVISLVTILALAGCKQTAPRTAEEVKQAVSQLEKPLPGLYRSTIKLAEFSVPGMSAAQSARMRTMFDSAQARDFCLTAADAAKGYEEMTKRLAQGKCTYDRFEAGGGTIDAAMTCEAMRGTISKVAMKGTLNPEGSQMHMTVEQSLPGMGAAAQIGVGGMKMVADVTSNRVGECPASAAVSTGAAPAAQ